MHLTPHTAHIWFAYTDTFTDAALLDRYQAFLSDDELARMRRFRFERDQHTFLVSKAMTRVVIGQYMDIAPRALAFSAHELGKPFVSGPLPEVERVRFNISHTRGVAMLGIILDAEIGVDVESSVRKSDLLKLARRFFAPQEYEDIKRTSSPEEQTSKFYQYWTLKESYSKARGVGLHVPMDQYAFALVPAPHLVMTDSQAPLLSHCHHTQYTPSPDHAAAVCVFSPAQVQYTRHELIGTLSELDFSQ